MRDDFREEAERRVKTTLLIEEIAKREKIETTPADLEAELGALARQYGQPREKIARIAGPQRRRAGRRHRAHEDHRSLDRTQPSASRQPKAGVVAGSSRQQEVPSWVTWFRWSSNRARAVSGRTTSTRGCSKSGSFSCRRAIDDGMSSLVIAQLLFLEREDADKDIDMYIN